MLKFGRKNFETNNIKVDKSVLEEPSPEPKAQKKNSLSEGIYESKGSKLSSSLVEFRDRAFEKLVTQIDFQTASQIPIEDLKNQIETFIGQFIEETNIKVSYKEQQQIAIDITDIMTGLGPLEPLLADSSITDIMVNGTDAIYIEQKGKLRKTDIKFHSKQQVMQVAQKIANEVGRRIDESSPMVDARLRDGSRVNIITNPVALEGTIISIRRFSSEDITFKTMIKNDNLSENMARFLEISASSRLNILVSGGTGAGKTTILNALSHCIHPQERIITIEDAAELRLTQPHVVRLESRPQSIEGRGKITIRDLLHNALRMRPDRIVIGECRGDETFDMLQAMNTGHDGSMSTLHANSAEEALNRLQNMVLMAGYDLPVPVIRNYIAGAIDLIIQVARMHDGTRRITQIMDVGDCKDGIIECKNIFAFKFESLTSQGDIIGEYQFLNSHLSSFEKIHYAGLQDELSNILK
ncbi:MAG: CpaF family protein [Alphaproteobacteria bacterium]|nr:CpaF family protein [Alphaproteobacteria bacterium]